MDARLEEIEAILKKYGQEHLLNHYDKLDDVHKQKLLEEIENIDFELVDSLYRSTEKKEKSTKDEITPIDYLDKYKLNDSFYYLNVKSIMDEDNYLNRLNNAFNTDKIKKVPTILYYRNGKIVDVVTRNDNNIINAGDFQKLLDIYGYEGQ